MTMLSNTIPWPILYPDSDGKPMSDNTLQGRWIIEIFDNLDAQYAEDENVFVAQNLLWYAVEGQPKICAAADVFVAFNRPKGYRGSYRQWEENNIPPSVVFEILSPSNTATDMDRKFLFYEEHGVDEYYVYDPEENHLAAYVRQGSVLRRVRPVEGFVSPRLGICFDMSGPEMVIRRPDGSPFQLFRDLLAERNREREKLQALQKDADTVARRLARMVELSRKVRRGEATPEDLAELQRLEDESAPPAS